eukprot:CAMPEP_0183718466 /NCGR_PEP_ID=MMETSP0737-20130205/11706_1 /TAXON_ID=385413 /ORGANISM="Thalassiosira miniscula, Strain CCMP1093" /LENGTH=532 /DNA_ID=CAMNT_0025948025 /DNA_START=142 /DNA_END=1740 /DNA_ORIENTATION=+
MCIEEQHRLMERDGDDGPSEVFSREEETMTIGIQHHKHNGRRNRTPDDDASTKPHPSPSGGSKRQYAFIFLLVATSFVAGYFSNSADHSNSSGDSSFLSASSGLLLLREDQNNNDAVTVAYADVVGNDHRQEDANDGKNDYDDKRMSHNDKATSSSSSSSSSPLYNATFANYLTSGMKELLAKNRETTTAAVTKKSTHYVYDSPYEKRWPGSKQPWWSRKIIPFNKYISESQQICFVHVGKTGGSTMGCMLGFSLHCDDHNEIKGLLPIATTHVFHRSINDCPEHAAYYLFVIRDPLARMLSDMNYERPNMTEANPFSKKFHTQELYQECDFWTLEDLAQKGLMNVNRDKHSHKCRQRANDALTGVGKYLTHGFFNYQFYTQSVFGTEDNKAESTIPENANLLVIRNSHMVDDYNTINEFLGGRPNVLSQEDIPVNNAHAKNATEMYLSKHSKIALCQTLCNEIQVYKDLLRRAINLNDADVKSSMDELKEVCPMEARERRCLERRPYIKRKIVYRKGELDGADGDDDEENE